MKLIPLTQNKFAIVDDADYEAVSRFKWHAHNKCGIWTAIRSRNHLGKRECMKMHRWIMCATAFRIDHKNGNGLDNRRSNLRFATHSQNRANSKLQCNNTSGYKGAYFIKARKAWSSIISVNKKRYNLGYFKNREDAAEAYRVAALHHFGEFAAPTGKSDDS